MTNPLCDCGLSKSKEAEACARCNFLDGSPASPLQAKVIEALRTLGESSERDISAFTKASRRALKRTFADLLRSGRVVRRWEEPTTWLSTTKTGTNPASNQGLYVYRLYVAARGEIVRAA